MSKAAQDFGVPMLRALGVDTKNVLGFTIKCEVGEHPTIAVTSVIPGEFGVPAAQIARLFKLEMVGEVSLPALDESAPLESLVRTTHRLADSQGSDRT